MQMIARWVPRFLLCGLLAGMLSGCGVNDIPTYDEAVKAAWAQVDNQYKRRADLIPNLVEVVKGYARQEQDTLTAVVEARAKATQTQIPSDILSNPEAFQQFQQNQRALTQALSRLMVVVERYPDLKSNQNFLSLQAQLEGTENRIAVRFAYEWHDDSGSWFRAYGNENWEFDEPGSMRRRVASINDAPIVENDRKFYWPLGRRPDDHPSLSDLDL